MARKHLARFVRPTSDDYEDKADYGARVQLFGLVAVVCLTLAVLQAVGGHYWSAAVAVVLAVSPSLWALRSYRGRRLRPPDYRR